MPFDLTDLDLDEISFVKSGANGKQFLIVKSANGGNKMIEKMKKSAGQVGHRADDLDRLIDSRIEKGLQPLREENAILRKTLAMQSDRALDAELAELARKEFSGLGTTPQVVSLLKSVRKLPEQERKTTIISLKKTSAMQLEAQRILFAKMGSSGGQPAPGSASEAFMIEVKRAKGRIEKSASEPLSPKLLHAKAVTLIAKSHPELARAYKAEVAAAKDRGGV